MTRLTAVFLFVVVGAIPALSQLQRAVLYDEYLGGGNYIVIPESYVPDLGEANFDNRVRSVCVTGIWLFYQDTNYNGAGPRGMEYVFGRNEYCVDIRTIPASISSLRYAGDPKDYTVDSFTLYQYDFFQGEEEYIRTDTPNIGQLAGNHQSIIITGDSNWEVYDRPSFQGNSICLTVPEPGTHTPSFISDTRNVVPEIPHGAIRSVRRGCSATKGRQVTLQSFARANPRNAFVPSNPV